MHNRNIRKYRGREKQWLRIGRRKRKKRKEILRALDDDDDDDRTESLSGSAGGMANGIASGTAGRRGKGTVRLSAGLTEWPTEQLTEWLRKGIKARRN